MLDDVRENKAWFCEYRDAKLYSSVSLRCSDAPTCLTRTSRSVSDSGYGVRTLRLFANPSELSVIALGLGGNKQRLDSRTKALIC